MDSINSHRSPETKTKPKATQTPPPGGKSGERQPSRLGAPTVEPQQLPCPRCQSTNTKFCYYNNYNLSQPRHFCKACRRYWTRGGTLRNVPVGGGTRKSSSSSNKRSRDDDEDGHGEGGDVTMIKAQAPEPAVTDPKPVPDPNPVPDYEPAGSTKLNDAVPSVEKQGNLSLSSWWNSAGLGPLDGYGLGFGSDPGPGIGYENGSLNWPIEQVNIGVEGGGALVSGESTGDSNWQVGGGGECVYFSWPELAIATPADAEK